MKLLLQALNDMKDGIKAKKKVKLAAFKKALAKTTEEFNQVFAEEIQKATTL